MLDASKREQTRNIACHLDNDEYLRARYRPVTNLQSQVSLQFLSASRLVDAAVLRARKVISSLYPLGLSSAKRLARSPKKKRRKNMDQERERNAAENIFIRVRFDSFDRSDICDDEAKHPRST